ncbi:MAG: hypothetical protein WCP28_20285 [Actinomycetes bacterium]
MRGTHTMKPAAVSPSRYGAHLGNLAREAERCELSERARRGDAGRFEGLGALECEPEPARAIGYAEHDRAPGDDIGRGVC